MAPALWLLSGAVLIALCVFVLDRPIATFSHDVLQRPFVAVLITRLADIRICFALAVGTLLVAGVFRMNGGWFGPLWNIALAAALSMLLAIVAIILLKYACGRLWPETWVQHNPSWISNHAYAFVPFHGGEGWGSFPSGHTARVTAPFAVLWQRVPSLRLVWALPPLVIALALVASNFHFLGDCVAGAYVGVGCAAAMLAIF
jgi:membrane-associated phospholipid phosphatase